MYKKSKEKQVEVKKTEAEIVKMKKGDIVADVHKSEVENYRAGGYSEA